MLELIYFDHHDNCEFKHANATLADCETCRNQYLDLLARFGTKKCDSNHYGILKTSLKDCKFCTKNIRILETLQQLRKEYFIVKTNELYEYEAKNKPGRNIHVHEYFQDHPCRPDLLDSKRNSAGFDCSTCVKLWDLLFCQKLHGPLVDHKCDQHSCQLCQRFIKYWDIHASIARMCFRFTVKFYEDIVRDQTGSTASCWDGNVDSINSFIVFGSLQAVKRLKEIIVQTRNPLQISLTISLNKAKIKIPTVVIEGSIGVGKSSVLKSVSESIFKDNMVVSLEPVSEWTNFQGENLLEKFYQSPKEYGFILQNLIHASKANQYFEQDFTDKHLHVVERSLSTSQLCFAAVLLKQGILTKLQFKTLGEIWKKNEQNCSYLTRLTKIIYLQCDPKTSLDRIRKRNRPSEAKITLEYLEALHDVYDDVMFNFQELTGHQVEVVYIDANQDEQIVLKECDQVILEILDEEMP